MDIEKLERLRNKQTINYGEGHSALYENGHLLTSEGEKIPVSEETRRLIDPQSPEEEKYFKEYQRQNAPSRLSKVPIVGPLLGGLSAISSQTKEFMGGPKKTGQFIESLGEAAANLMRGESPDLMKAYERKREVSGKLSGEISEEYPIASPIGTGLGIAGDIAGTGKFSGYKGAALSGTALAASHMGPEAFMHPGEFAKEAAIGAGFGLAGEALFGTLSKLGALRKARSDAKAAATLANEQAGEAHRILAGNIEQADAVALKDWEAKMLSHKANVDQLKAEHAQKIVDRKNEIINNKNVWEDAKRTKAANELQLENEYKIKKDMYEADLKAGNELIAQEEAKYQAALKNVKNVQADLNKLHMESVEEAAKRIENAFPAGAEIHAESFGVDKFVSEVFENTPQAVTTNSEKFTKMINNLFGKSKKFSPTELSQKYVTLERFALDHPEFRPSVSAFKEFLSEKLPMILADSQSYSKMMPFLKKQLNKALDDAIKAGSDKLGKGAFADVETVNLRMRPKLDKIIENVNSNNFIGKIEELKKHLQENVVSYSDIRKFSEKEVKESLKKAKKQGMITTEEEYAAMKAAHEVPITAYNHIKYYFDEGVKEAFDRLSTDLYLAPINAEKKLAKYARSTMVEPGVAPVPERPETPDFGLTAPERPAALPEPAMAPTPPEVNPLQLPPEPLKPSPTAIPEAPIPQKVPEPSGVMERLAEGLNEYSITDLVKGHKGGDSLSKIGLLHLIGLPKAVAGATTMGGLKALTSPSAFAQTSRIAAQKGVMAAVDYMLRKYPSYSAGVIRDPMERRAATREIEDNPDFSLADKAVYQAKINKGISIDRRL